MPEVRNATEGTLRWVVQSGSGTAWATASAPASGLVGYVTNFTFTSGRTITPISNRGIPAMHKFVSKEVITLSFDVQWGITADYPPTTSTGAGATVPMIGLELRSTAPEIGSSLYQQFYGCAILSNAFTEANPANTQTWQMQALAMGPITGSGYLG